MVNLLTFSETKKEVFDPWSSKIFALLTKNFISTSLGVPILKHFHIPLSVTQMSPFLNSFH